MSGSIGTSLLETSYYLASEALRIGAIRLNAQQPFVWASGYQMPIYNDNRMLVSDPRNRGKIGLAFAHIIELEEIPVDVIAGTSTAGISPATTLADLLEKRFIYVRDKPKDHGLRNQIEGIAADKNLEGRRVIVVEDLISTGASSAATVQAVRDANGIVDYCFSIFNYDFDEAKNMFAGTTPFKEDKRLATPCKVRSLLTYQTLLLVAEDEGYLKANDADLLREWRQDPFGWGEKRGFSKVEKER